MNKRKKLALVGTLIVVALVIGIIWQVVDVNKKGKSPLASLFEAPVTSTVEETAPTAAPVTIILREEAPTPTPSPTPTPTPTVAPTAVPTKNPTPTPKSGTSSAFEATEAPKSTAEPTVEPTAAPTAEPTVTPTPTPKATPTPRPQVIESTPEPTPEPEMAEITLDTYSVEILTGDQWRINILSAPSSLRDEGATWVSGNSSVVKLAGSDTSGVTITGIAPGTTKVTVYSRSGLSASCTVTVS